MVDHNCSDPAADVDTDFVAAVDRHVAAVAVAAVAVAAVAHSAAIVVAVAAVVHAPVPAEGLIVVAPTASIQALHSNNKLHLSLDLQQIPIHPEGHLPSLWVLVQQLASPIGSSSTQRWNSRYVPYLDPQQQPILLATLNRL